MISTNTRERHGEGHVEIGARHHLQVLEAGLRARRPAAGRPARRSMKLNSNTQQKIVSASGAISRLRAVEGVLDLLVDELDQQLDEVWNLPGTPGWRGARRGRTSRRTAPPAAPRRTRCRRLMTEKSTMPCGSLFDRNVRWWRMYSVAPGAFSAAMPVSPIALTHPSARGHASRVRRGSAPTQRHPVHQEGRGEPGEHRQRHHPHHLQHHHEQHDHDDELHRLADVERPRARAGPIRAAPPNTSSRHRQAAGGCDAAPGKRRERRSSPATAKATRPAIAVTAA